MKVNIRESPKMGILTTWLVTTISFLIISRLPIGIEIDSFGKAIISAAVFGILNAILLPILALFTLPFIILTLGLFFFVLNSIIFGLAAAIVPGFRLRYGFWSSTIGSIALAIINSILLAIAPPIL
jgi:putative membrane protein